MRENTITQGWRERNKVRFEAKKLGTLVEKQNTHQKGRENYKKEQDEKKHRFHLKGKKFSGGKRGGTPMPRGWLEKKP